MSKRPTVDLLALTANQATPMVEAVQRAPSQPKNQKKAKRTEKQSEPEAKTASENYEALAFKVSPEFRRRFRQRAVTADLKLNELLF